MALKDITIELPTPRLLKLADAALFLDLDGTLAPIAARPQDVRPDPRRTALVQRLNQVMKGRLAVVSGRTLADIDRILEGRVTSVAAVHGLLRREPDGTIHQMEPHPALPQAAERFREFAARDSGLIVEEKGLSVALHYRLARKHDATARALAVEIAEATGLTLQSGDMVEELRTPGPTKGDSVESFLSQPPFAGRTPVFLGDDATDEHGFEAVHAAGGYGVLVGPPRDTHAQFRLPGVEGVLTWLEASLLTRLIVVSNRVSPPSGKGEETVGGLSMALAAALREYSGLWFGWSGKTTPQFSGQLQMQKVDGVTTATIDLADDDYDEYYNGYANKTLWPLLHYRTDLTAYDRVYGEGYERVNKRFAETLRPLIEKDDLIWIHDYHLIPLGRELRRLGVKNRMGFFLHTPWPAYQIFTTLPGHRQLVQAMFDYDLVGFHTQEYQQAFEEYVLTEAGGQQVSDGMLKAFGRTVKVGAFPIGIDAADFARMLKSPRARRMRDIMTACAVFRRLIVGVDRLDYSKGLEERFLGFERLLADNPDLRREVLMLQIAPVSREGVEAYQEIRGRLDALSGRINGEFADVDWQPFRYVNKNYRRDELGGIYGAARVGLVTPLRDGMNLVAKEFVAAQNPDDPGVLILSRFAGAARQLKEALLVNPNSPEEIAEALKQALAMGKPERIRRWRALNENVQREDVTAWRDAFVSELAGVQPRRTALAS